MSKTRDTGFINNILKYDNDGNVSVVSGSTTLLFISSSGAITTTGIISGSNALSASYAVSASNSLAAATASYVENAQTASYVLNGVSASYAASASNSISGAYAVNSTTASFSLTGTSASYAVNSTTASYAVDATNAANSTLFNNTASSVFATTGSNTLTGVQYVSNTNNAVGFSNTTASIYTDGGLQVTKDAYYSSSIFIKGNLTVFGTQSVSFITSSQLNISTNLITVNTDTPSIRFGGLAVYDSGSTGLTGSILWDSQNNHWVYTNPSGSSYSGGMFISGPRASSLGSEQGTTNNALMKGQGGDHITSSAVFEVSGSVGIGTSSPKTYSSLTSAGQIIGLNNIAIDSGQSFRLNNYYNSGTVTDRAISTGHAASFGLDQANGGITFNISAATSSADSNITTTERMRITSGGNVGIGTTNPSQRLSVTSADNTSSTNIARFAAANNTLAIGIGYESIRQTETGGIIAFETNATERLRINQYGQLLINATSSTYSANLFGYNLGVRGTNNQTFISIARANQNLDSQGIIFGLDTTQASLFVFDNIPLVLATSGSERIRITSGGLVGIGTSSPLGSAAEKTLHLSSGGGYATIYVTNSTNAVRSIFGMQSSENLGIVGTQSDTPFAIFTNDTGRIRITSDGKVGIGITNPTKTFQVSGRSGINTIVSNNLIAGNISSNLSAANAPNFILLFNMTDDIAGWSMSGTVNAAAWDCWNISTIWIRRLYDTFTVNAGITGLYKSGCDFAICDVTYNSKRYIALRFTSNPEIDVMWTGYGLDSMFTSSGLATIVYSGVSVNSTIASY